MIKYFLRIRPVFTLLSALAVALLVTCEGKQANKTNMSTNKSISASDLLGNPDYPALSYGGYRSETRKVQPTLAQLKDDMRILHAMGIRVIRTYNVHFAHSSNVLKAIRELKDEQPDFEMYVMLGAWIDCLNAWTGQVVDHRRESPSNAVEITRAVELANQYPTIVKMIAVGNEAMVKWAAEYYVEPAIILKWVTHLQDLKRKGELNQEVWITSSDNFASWGGGDSIYHVPELTALIQSVDFISMHTYPMHDTFYNPSFWGVQQSENELTKEARVVAVMRRSVYYAQKQYQQVRQYVAGIAPEKPIHIGETGWTSSSNEMFGSEGTKAADEFKQAHYYHLLREWTREAGLSCFYFQAFDEPWKDSDNPGGSENFFGLFTVDGKAKYALWELVDSGVLEGLKRDGSPITKTYSGDKIKLLDEVYLPPVKEELMAVQ